MKNSRVLWLISLTVVLFCMQGCCFSPFKKIAPKEMGTRDERIEFHKLQIERYQAAVQKEENILSRALTEQKMNDIRTSNLKMERYLLRLQQHKDKLKELLEMQG